MSHSGVDVADEPGAATTTPKTIASGTRWSLSLMPAGASAAPDDEVQPGVPGPDDAGPRPLRDHAARTPRARAPDSSDSAVRSTDAGPGAGEREPDHPRDAAADRGRRRRRRRRRRCGWGWWGRGGGGGGGGGGGRGGG